jgi:hypothetical protein
MKVLVLNYGPISSFYYLRLIHRVINDKKMKKIVGHFLSFFTFITPGHLAKNKQSILSKSRFLSLNCCFINCNPILPRVLSRIDYANSLLFGFPKPLSVKLQRVQNAAARLIVGVGKYEHISDHLRFLHWLPDTSTGDLPRVTCSLTSFFSDA